MHDSGIIDDSYENTPSLTKLCEPLRLCDFVADHLAVLMLKTISQ
jgi:hypothetical protein